MANKGRNSEWCNDSCKKFRLVRTAHAQKGRGCARALARSCAARRRRTCMHIACARRNVNAATPFLSMRSSIFPRSARADRKNFYLMPMYVSSAFSMSTCMDYNQSSWLRGSVLDITSTVLAIKLCTCYC